MGGDVVLLDRGPEAVFLLDQRAQRFEARPPGLTLKLFRNVDLVQGARD